MTAKFTCLALWALFATLPLALAEDKIFGGDGIDLMAGSDVQWSDVDRQMSTVSCGHSGVWAVTSSGQPRYRKNSYGSPQNEGNSWSDVDGELVQLDVGKEVVWGVNSGDNIYIRTGISFLNGKGTQWKQVDGQLTHVSVSDDNAVWGVNSEGEVYMREGVSSLKKEGTRWKEISAPSGRKMEQISVGKSGVWAVSSNRKVYYRSGTFGGRKGDSGTRWDEVRGESLVYVSSATDVVFGLDRYDNIYRRDGISALSPKGSRWTKVNGKLRNMDATGRSTVWGVNKSKVLFIGEH